MVLKSESRFNRTLQIIVQTSRPYLEDYCYNMVRARLLLCISTQLQSSQQYNGVKVNPYKQINSYIAVGTLHYIILMRAQESTHIDGYLYVKSIKARMHTSCSVYQFPGLLKGSVFLPSLHKIPIRYEKPLKFPMDMIL